MEIKKRILYLGSVWPEPVSSAAGVRTSQILAHLQGHDITYGTPGALNEHSQALEKRGIATQVFPLNDSAIQEFLADHPMDVVIYDRFVVEEQFGSRVREALPGIYEILDTQDLHSLRWSREQDLTGTPADEGDLLRELASILRCDWTWVVSKVEKALLESEYEVPANRVSCIPFSAQNPWTEGLDFEERKDFVFLGNFRHAPNRDGVHWFAKEVWPGIRKLLGNVNWDIYGAYLPKDVSDLPKSYAGIRVRGWAENLAEVLPNYRLSVAPLRFGAGIKGKVLESWSYGTPVVGTVLAFEGMGVEPDADWIQEIPRLYGDRGVWTQARNQARERLTHSFDAKRIAELFQAEWSARMQGATERPSYLKRILLQEAYGKTKYFSRWIELKNIHKSSPSP